VLSGLKVLVFIFSKFICWKWFMYCFTNYSFYLCVVSVSISSQCIMLNYPLEDGSTAGKGRNKDGPQDCY
jgi:hypothetical protein